MESSGGDGDDTCCTPFPRLANDDEAMIMLRVAVDGCGWAYVQYSM